MYDHIWPKLLDLLGCLEATLVSNGVPAVRTFIAPGGPPPWDSCCVVGNAEGQAWVQLQSVNPTNDFPRQTGPQRLGFGEWAVTVNLGILRCAATLNDQGEAPPVEAMMANAEKVNRDRVLLHTAIECCFLPELDVEGGYLVGGWTPLGPGGGCVGGQQTFQFVADVCGCPEIGPAPDYEEG